MIRKFALGVNIQTTQSHISTGYSKSLQSVFLTSSPPISLRLSPPRSSFALICGGPYQVFFAVTAGARVPKPRSTARVSSFHDERVISLYASPVVTTSTKDTPTRNDAATSFITIVLLRSEPMPLLPVRAGTCTHMTRLEKDCSKTDFRKTKNSYLNHKPTKGSCGRHWVVVLSGMT